jgi:Zn-dependent peptidase ImmA (M78 family)
MSIPDNWQNYAKSKVEEILQEIKDSSGLKVPIPISEIIESYLGDVHCVVRMDDDLFPEGVSAFSTKDMTVGWIIVVNGRETPERQRFSAAHELAHIVLFKTNPKTVFCSNDKKRWDERLCDQFAGDILMPENMVRGLYKLNVVPFVEDIAKSFKVSRQVAEIQLKRLGLSFISRAAIKY